MNDSGWDKSAEAWIADMGDTGDWGRQFVLDDVMLSRAKAGQYKRALDVGCGEGRFCRKLRDLGMNVVGLDPTQRLLEEARKKDSQGDYRMGVGEALPFADKTFDLVVSYLSLVDIEFFEIAIREMNRVLRPGGIILVANLTSFATARTGNGWEQSDMGALYFKMDDYLRRRSTQESWRGIEIRNRHRPLSAYIQAFLAQGLLLTYFDEPAPYGDDSPRAAKFRHAPWYVVMEWAKPGTREKSVLALIA